MQKERFDAFGEPVTFGEPPVDIQGRVGGWIMTAGTGLFWSLVVVIVAARALYFDPDIAGKFGQLEAFARTIRAIFAA